jgi:uncharacterized membrane protein YoaK (UPF0700 family)
MTTFMTEVRETLVPDRSGRFGPLPPLLVTMTVVTGLVDSFSYLLLGHVFVANMTGNVVFLGFAVAGAHGFSISASLVALVSFGMGSVLGGRMIARSPLPPFYHYALIVVLSLAMGVQNSSTRKLAVPDLTTTVLTLTVTGIGADSTLGGGKGSKSGRRLISVAAMFVGAVAGAALVLHVRIIIPLAIALVLILIVGGVSYRAGRSDPRWTRVED